MFPLCVLETHFNILHNTFIYCTSHTTGCINFVRMYATPGMISNKHAFNVSNDWQSFSELI